MSEKKRVKIVKLSKKCVCGNLKGIMNLNSGKIKCSKCKRFVEQLITEFPEKEPEYRTEVSLVEHPPHPDCKITKVEEIK